MTRLPEHAPRTRESAKKDAKEFKRIATPSRFLIFFASSFALSRLRGAFLM
jgi:hypothetical protein